MSNKSIFDLFYLLHKKLRCIEASEHLLETLLFVPKNSGQKVLGHAWPFMCKICTDMLDAENDESKSSLRNKLMQVRVFHQRL